MTAAGPWDRAAEAMPGLLGLLALALLLYPVAPWVRRRNWVRAARHHWTAHPSIRQASQDRGPVPGQEET